MRKTLLLIVAAASLCASSAFAQGVTVGVPGIGGVTVGEPGYRGGYRERDRDYDRRDRRDRDRVYIERD